MTRRRWTVMSAALVWACVMVWSVCGYAQQARGQAMDLGESHIKGELQRPGALYILQHARLDYERVAIKPSFVPQLLATVDEDPF